MASQDSKDSLDILQQMFNDVLVQTGKALRASRKDVAGDTVHVQAPGQLRLPETLRTFHSALDDLETEIVRAKSVMQRDLSRLQANNSASAAAPQPVESQSKSPLVIDVESSPHRGGDTSTSNTLSDTKPVAPFPDMGMDMSLGQSDDATSLTLQGDQAADHGSGNAEAQPIPSMVPESPAADVTVSESKSKSKEANPGAGTDSQNPEETFTNMEFTLAPTDTNAPPESTANDPAFDLSQFTTNDAGGDSLTLDSLLPQNPRDQAASDSVTGADVPSGEQGNSTDAHNELQDPAFDALTMDFGAADGTDFDFSMGDGNTFDDLISTHEQNSDTTMEHGQSDVDFFGLGQTDET